MTILTHKSKHRELSAQLLWTALILVFFVLQAILWTTAISLTAGDKSHTVVAGYDEQALNWDEVKQRQANSEKLGWTAKLEVKSGTEARKVRELTFRLADRHRQSIAGATVELSAFHRGRAAEKQQIQLQPLASSPGIYIGKVNVQHAGKWQFSGSARLGEDCFLIDHRTDIEIEN